jgi:cytochrome P450
MTPWLAAMVLTAAAGWCASPIADRRFRDLYPKVAAGLATAAATTTGVALLAAALLPTVVVLSAAMVVVVGSAATWLRALVGRRLGEPPGHRSPVAGIRDLAHRDAYLTRFERYGPVTVASQFGRTVVCVEGLERGQRLVRDHRSAIGPSPLAFTQQMMGDFLRYMDDETHDIYGPLFRRALGREVTEAARSTTEAAAGRMLTGLDPSPRDPTDDLRRIAEQSLAQALFGLDLTSDAGERFLATYRPFSARAIQHRASASARAQLDELRTQTLRLLERPSAAPSTLHELRRLDPEMPDAVAIDNLLFMLRIGSANTAALMAWGLHHLGAEPTMRARLAGGEPGIADAIVLETLRLAQSEYLYRRIRHDVEFDGHLLRRGWLVRVCVWESHRDPESFECPHAFTDRFLHERPSQARYSPFGFDRHACNASGLATMIAGTVLAAVAADRRVTIRPASSIVRDFRHWSHWRPGPELALSATMATGHVR